MALDRSKALGIELKRLRSQQYPPSGPQRLIELAIHANERIGEDLSGMLADQTVVSAIPSLEVEISLRAKTNLLAYLHLLMQCVEGAEVQRSPSTLVVPIRRLLEKHLNDQDFEFIVRASRRYNYSIRSIAQGIQKVFSEAGYLSLLDGFCKQFFIIDCPISEKRNVPIHCMFAHEIGHALYKSNGLANILLSLISVDENELDKLLTTHALQRDTGETNVTSVDTLQIRRIEHAVKVLNIASCWVEELSADALALCLLGPAYLFAFVYFAGPFASIDTPSDTHPPDRMRIEFMCDMLMNQKTGLAYNKVLDDTTRDYVEQWKGYAGQPSDTRSTELSHYSIAIKGIEPVLERIKSEAKRITKGRRYNPKKFNKDVPPLFENLANGIPPNEIMDDWTSGKFRTAEAEAILNAGWVYLISRDGRYASLLGIPEDPWRVTNRLFDLVSKGLEYAEMQRRWSYT